MADRDTKALTAEIECPTFEHVAFTKPRPLADSCVAIVTTASLHHPDQDDFTSTDATLRVLDAKQRDWQLGHWSPNFDSSGYALDPNVVFPIDRLHELVASGRIGRVSDQHLAYAGNQFELSTIRLDSGPAGAELLRRAGVDVVILTPV